MGSLLISAAFSNAQIPNLKQIVEKPEKTAAAAPVDPRKLLEKWLKETHDSQANLDAAVGLPKSIKPEQVDERRQELEQIVYSIEQALKTFGDLEDAKKSLEVSRSEESTWTGFPEKPPYPLPMIDDLLNERDAIKSKLDATKYSQKNIEDANANLLNEAKAAEEAVGAAILATQSAKSPEDQGATLWKLESSRSRSRFLAIRGIRLQKSLETLNVRADASRLDLSLINRKIKTASANSRFSDEDFAKLERISADRKKALDKEKTALSKRLSPARSAVIQAQGALDALLSKSSDSDPSNDPKPEDVELAKLRLESAISRVDSIQAIAENLDSLNQFETYSLSAYRDRRAVIDASISSEKQKALGRLQEFLKRLETFKVVTANNISGVEADLEKNESRFRSLAADNPRFPFVNDQRIAAGERLDALKRMAQAIDSERKLVGRWVDSYSGKSGKPRFLEQVSSLASSCWGFLKKIWSFEIKKTEETVVIEGQTITHPTSYTLGKLLETLLFFVVGYRIASYLANRVQRGLVSSKRLAAHQARMLRNWAMIIIAIFWVIVTLQFFNLSLTVFAFVGGALVIGLGFGMQAFIKNLISGIIVLLERKVRVGDVLNVDGIVGVVTEVNARSSIIRSSDNMETMIPNSIFLETKITNHTLTDAKVRALVKVGVCHSSDPKAVIEVLSESASRHGLVCKEPAPYAVFDDFAEYGLIFVLYFWVDIRAGGSTAVVASDLRLMIEKRFSELEISLATRSSSKS